MGIEIFLFLYHDYVVAHIIRFFSMLLQTFLTFFCQDQNS